MCKGLRRGDSSLCPVSLLCFFFSSSQSRPILKSSVRLPFCVPALSRGPKGVTSPRRDVPRCLTGVSASEVCAADRPPPFHSLVLCFDETQYLKASFVLQEGTKRVFRGRRASEFGEHPGFPTWHTCLSLNRGLLQATSAPGSMISVSWHRQIRHVDRPRLPLAAFDVRVTRLSSDARPGERPQSHCMNPERRFYCKSVHICTAGAGC